jgi:hypothetical protein
MLKTPQQTQQTQQGSILSATAVDQQQKQRQTQQMDKMVLDRVLRQKRSKAYMDAIHKLDAGGHVANQGMVNEIIEAIQNEFPEVELSGVLLGYVATCFLGKPYEVHILDVAGKIVQHYETGHALPGGLEKARSIAIRGGYAFIEVYSDCCRAVSSNGSVSVIAG